jgi:hypothetical protein
VAPFGRRERRAERVEDKHPAPGTSDMRLTDESLSELRISGFGDRADVPAIRRIADHRSSPRFISASNGGARSASSLRGDVRRVRRSRSANEVPSAPPHVDSSTKALPPATAQADTMVGSSATAERRTTSPELPGFSVPGIRALQPPCARLARARSARAAIHYSQRLPGGHEPV